MVVLASFSPLAIVGLLSLPLWHASPAHTQDTPAWTHVRSGDSQVREDIRRGLEHSPTFTDIVSQIGRLPGLVDVVSSRRGLHSWLDACLDHTVGEQAGRPAVTVEVVNQAGIRASTLARATRHVSNLSREGGEVLWTDAALKDAPGRLAIHLSIRPKASALHVMGSALADAHGTGGIAFVYRDRVLDVARERDLDVSRLLAYAMAHEMGHRLLPYLAHSPTGLMRAEWDVDDLRRLATGSLRITLVEASAIRAAASEGGAAAAALVSAESRLTNPQNRLEDRRVRSLQPEVVALVRDGIERSATFAALVAALNASDVVAYIESSLRMPARFDGYLIHRVTTVPDRRYLWIVVDAGLERDRLISTIAHELQHAVEIAQAMTVRSDEAIDRFFQSIDSRRCGLRCTETDAALRVQDVVLRELRNSRTGRGSEVASNADARTYLGVSFRPRPSHRDAEDGAR